MIYKEDEKVVDRALQSMYLSNLEDRGQAYELESRKWCMIYKWRITYNEPLRWMVAFLCLHQQLLHMKWKVLSQHLSV